MITVLFASVLAILPGVIVPQERRSYVPLESVLRIERPQLIIGEEHREGPALFGEITAIATDAAGNVYVLDGINHSVRAFSGTGRHLGSVGGPGRGPGELRDPLSIWHDGTATLYVVDRYDGISRFDTPDGKPVYASRFGAELTATAVCTLHGELVAGAIRDDRILHVLTRDGELTRSFGELFRRDSHPGIQATYNTGRLALTCDEEQERIFVAEGNRELVRGYDRSGRLLWQTALPEYLGNRVHLDSRRRGAVVVGFGQHVTRAMTFVDPDLLIVQAQHRTRRRDPSRGGASIGTDHGIVTYILSASTGTVLTRQYGAPFFLGATDGGRAIGYNDEPFPRIFFSRVAGAR